MQAGSTVIQTEEQLVSSEALRRPRSTPPGCRSCETQISFCKQIRFEMRLKMNREHLIDNNKNNKALFKKLITK